MNKQKRYTGSSYENTNKTRVNSTFYKDSEESRYYNKFKYTDQSAEVYTEMLQDDQINLIFKIIKNFLESAEWDFFDFDNANEEKINLLRKVFFDDLEIKNKIDELISYLVYGYAFFVKKFNNLQDNNLGLYTTITDLIFLDQLYNTNFVIDETNGDLINFQQCIQINGKTIENEIYAKDLFKLYNSKKGNNLGQSLLRPLFEPFYTKKKAYQMLRINMNKTALPTYIVKVGTDTESEDNELQNVRVIMDALEKGNASTIAIPADIDNPVSTIEYTNSFKDIQDIIDRQNLIIADASFTGIFQLSTNKSSSSGSFALSSTLQQELDEILEGYKDVIERAINQQLVKDVLIKNYGTYENSPYLKITPSLKQNVDYINIVNQLFSLDILTDENKENISKFLTDIYKIPNN